MVISSKLRNQSILKSFYLWEQNSLKVSQVQAYTESLWCFLFLQIILSNCSQKYHEESCKFQLRVSGYFDVEYRKILPWQVIEQKLRRCHHNQFSCNLLILLLARRIWNIQTIAQYLNWDSTKALKGVLLLLKESNFAILERALNFWSAFPQSFRTCSSNFRSLSIVIPISLTSLLSQIKSFHNSPIFMHVYNPKLSDVIYPRLVSYNHFQTNV